MGRLSARRIGEFLGKTAREVNEELTELGLLDGEPGAYSLTEAGEEYGQDHDHDNGYGGYAHRSWSTRTWDPSVIAELGSWDPLAIDWHCDNCRTYMNDQSDFDCSGGTWTCTECGFLNDVSPNNLR